MIAFRDSSRSFWIASLTIPPLLSAPSHLDDLPMLIARYCQFHGPRSKQKQRSSGSISPPAASSDAASAQKGFPLDAESTVASGQGGWQIILAGLVSPNHSVS
jgi:hypothetical protein